MLEKEPARAESCKLWSSLILRYSQTYIHTGDAKESTTTESRKYFVYIIIIIRECIEK